MQGSKLDFHTRQFCTLQAYCGGFVSFLLMSVHGGLLIKKNELRAGWMDRWAAGRQDVHKRQYRVDYILLVIIHLFAACNR